MTTAETAAAAADANAAAAALLVNRRADALTSLHRAAAFFGCILDCALTWHFEAVGRLEWCRTCSVVTAANIRRNDFFNCLKGDGYLRQFVSRRLTRLRVEIRSVQNVNDLP